MSETWRDQGVTMQSDLRHIQHIDQFAMFRICRTEKKKLSLSSLIAFNMIYKLVATPLALANATLVPIKQ